MWGVTASSASPPLKSSPRFPFLPPHLYPPAPSPLLPLPPDFFQQYGHLLQPRPPPFPPPRLGHTRLHHQPVAVFHPPLSQIPRLGLSRRALLVQSRFRIARA